MFKNVASQKAIFFAFDTTTGAAKTGDAANITPYESLDYGSVTAITDTSMTEMDSTNAKGYYICDLTQAETNANTIMFSAKSSTSNIAVIGAPSVVFTDPQNYTLASIDSNGRLDIIKIAGTTQTARDIGASVLLSNGTGTGQLKLASGYVAMTWADVAAPTTTVNLSGTTIATTQKVDVETIKTNPVVNAGTITFPTTATLASTTNITAGTITTVTNLTNAATAGDFTATMKTSIGTAVAASAVASVTGDVNGNVVGNVAGSVASVTAAVGITSNIKKNQALAKFEFLMTDSTTHAPKTGLTVTVTRSIDGGAFAAGTLSAVTEVANGIYYVDFGAGDLNGKVVTLQATAAAADTTFERVVTQI